MAQSVCRFRFGSQQFSQHQPSYSNAEHLTGKDNIRKASAEIDSGSNPSAWTPTCHAAIVSMNRQAGRQVDRQAGRQTSRQEEAQTNRQIEKDRHTQKHTGKQRDKPTGR